MVDLVKVPVQIHHQHTVVVMMMDIRERGQFVIRHFVVLLIHVKKTRKNHHHHVRRMHRVNVPIHHWHIPIILVNVHLVSWGMENPVPSTIRNNSSNSSNQRSNMMEKLPLNPQNVYSTQDYSADVPNPPLTHVMDITIVLRKKCVWRIVTIGLRVSANLVMFGMRFMGAWMNILQD